MPKPKILTGKLALLNLASLESIQGSSEREVIKQYAQRAIDILGADFGYAWFKSPGAGKYELLYTSPGIPYTPDYPRSNGITAEAISSRQPILIESVKNRASAKKDAKSYMSSAAVIPLNHRKLTYGIFVLAYKKKHTFTTEERDLATAIGNSAAQAITINRLYNELKDFRKTLDNTLDSIFIFDPQTLKILYVNKGAVTLSGINRGTLLKKTMLGIRLSISETDLRQKIEKIRTRPKNYTLFEGTVNHPEKGRIAVEISLQHINESGIGEHFLAIIRDISERKLAERSMTKMAYYDQLTGIPNRALLTERLQQEHQLAHINKGMYTLFFIDLDRFKIINDIYGHGVGDALLQQVAQRMRKVLPKKSTLARMGGDEFIVLLPSLASVEEAEDCARKILSIFVDFFHINDQEIYCNGSIGFAIYPLDGVDHHVVMKHADLALHRAKERGGGNFQQYHMGQPSFYTMQPKLQSQLRHALKRGELTLHYQPIINVKNKRIIGTEALVRWNHPEMGLMYPVDFVGQAEESGLIIEIGEWVVEEVCRQIREWEKQGRIPPPVSINVSPRELLRPTLVNNIDKALKKYKISPSQVKLELTETFLMKNIDLSISILEQLKALGLRILIDDFGTGYASLNYLKRLPIDAVKVDRTFIAGVPVSLQDAALTSAIIAISHQLGLEVIAEGVENLSQFEFLRAAQCNFAQGNFFFKPVTGQQLADLLNLSQPARSGKR